MLLQGQDLLSRPDPLSGDASLPTIVYLLEEQCGLDLRALGKVWDPNSKETTSIEELLLRTGRVTDRHIAEAYAGHFLLPLYDPTEQQLMSELELCEVFPARLCRDHLLAPVAKTDAGLRVAFFSPDGLLLLDELSLLSGSDIQPCFAPLTTLERRLGVLFEDGAWTPSVVPGDTDFEEVEENSGDDDEEAAAEEVIHLDQPPPPGRDGRVIRYVNQIFDQSLKRGASDIHIEPFEESCRVRLRIDGGLTEISPPPMSMFTPIVSRIKVLAKMDIAEKRIPQDGAIALRTGERRVDMRVNTCPTAHGEKVVLRVLDKNAIPLQMTGLGMDERQDRDLTTAIQMPHGLMLVTGPTGSGKSTTLYSALNFLNQPDVNICTVEDPVEYKFAGINQVQTRAQVGLTFASALRAFLRQDPDVIMVGEVRDAETADICLRAALTGHFVLSTLHTNDALSAVTRLGEMGVEPFLLASTLRVVVAQRLIRKICTHCREPYFLNQETSSRVDIPADIEIFRPIGCNECGQNGYKGRIGVFEVIRITRTLGDLIQRHAPLHELRKAAAEQGMKLLGRSAAEKVCEGQTSLEEALSITVSEEEE